MKKIIGMENSELIQELRKKYLPDDRDIRNASALQDKYKEIISNAENVVAITDSDFISEKDLAPYEASVLYGVLKSADDTRMLVASIYYSQTSSMPLLSISVLKNIAARLREVIDRLKTFAGISNLYVVVPFYAYKNTLEGTVHQYELALNTVQGILDAKDMRQWISESASQSFIESDSYISHKALMEYGNVCLDLYNLLSLFEFKNNALDARAVTSEMHRRGYFGGTYTPDNKDCRYRDLLVGKYPLSKMAQPKGKESDVSLVNKVGVLVYMLYDSVRDTKTLTRLAHYAFNNNKPYKEPFSDNTEYTYIAKPASRIADDYERLDYIKGELLKYGYTESDFNRITKAIEENCK